MNRGTQQDDQGNRIAEEETRRTPRLRREAPPLRGHADPARSGRRREGELRQVRGSAGGGKGGDRGQVAMDRPVPAQGVVSTARVEIEAKTRGEIEVYVDGRGKTRIHEGARNLSLNVSDDGDRFLVELIQNAHDAHPSGSQDGEIAVVFDPTECEFGCLYVQNRGNGFSKENFLAITNIALSSKPVNESIGNKGLGFRSVLQICKWPEIYSVSGVGDSNEFDGYCFRFANAEDVASFLNGTETQGLAEEILTNMPCWYLPVYASEHTGFW